MGRIERFLFDPQTRPLHHAVRLSSVIYFLGRLLVVLAVLTSAPALSCLLEGSWHAAVRYVALAAAFAAFGAISSRAPKPSELQSNEALVIVALAFLIPSSAFAIPFREYGLSWEDAFFESVSGITTTGLTVAVGLESMPRSFHFARAWLQWVGGMGVISLAIALLIGSGMATKKLSGGEGKHDIVGGTLAYVRRAVAVYGVLTVFGVFWLMAFGAGWFDALVHCLAAVSTGGFSPYQDSLRGLGNPPLQFALTTLSFCGAISLLAYCGEKESGWRALLRDPQLRLLGACAFAGAAVLMVTTGGISSGVGVRNAALMAVSAQTTTGFSSMAPSDLPAAGQLIVVLSMFTGGSLGSTAGGIKLLRLLILFRLIHTMLMRVSSPHGAHIDVNLEGRRLSGKEIQSAAAVVAGYAGVTFAGWLIFLISGHQPLASLFEVTSAIGTVGLSSGITSPALEPGLKFTLCVLMLFGRVEIGPFLVLLFPGTWLGRRRKAR